MKTVIAYAIMDLFFLAKIEQIAKNNEAPYSEAWDITDLREKVYRAPGKLIIVFDPDEC